MAKKKQNLTPEELLEQALVPEHEWPYKVPENWVWTNFGKSIDLISGRDVSLNFCNERGKGIPYILGASNLNNDSFHVERWIESPVVKSISGDILISVKGTIGKIYLQKEPEINISRQIMAIRCSEIVGTKYVLFFLNSIVEYLKEAGNGLIPGISREILLDYKFPLPPLAEQQRIVDRIESLFEKLDQAKGLIQDALDSFENRKAAILHKAFSGELTKKWRDENGVGMESWEEKKIEEIGTVKGGKRLPKGEQLTDTNTGFPYIKAGDLKNGTVQLDKIQYLRPEIQKLIKNYTVSEGDIYITIVGACIGDVGVIPLNVDGANLTENAAKITELKCDSMYLGICMSSSIIQSQIKEKVASATLGKLSLQNIKTLVIPLPIIEEQKEIVRILKSLLDKELLAKELYDCIDNIEMLKKSILARAFRGELGTNDPSEESAKRLLEKIFAENGGELI